MPMHRNYMCQHLKLKILYNHIYFIICCIILFFLWPTWGHTLSVPRRRRVHSLCHCHEGSQRENQGCGAQEHSKNTSTPKKTSIASPRALLRRRDCSSTQEPEEKRANGRQNGGALLWPLRDHKGTGPRCLLHERSENTVIFKVYHSNTGTSNSTSPGDSDTELTSTEPITSKKTPPDSTSDEPTSPPNKTTHRQQQQQHTQLIHL